MIKVKIIRNQEQHIVEFYVTGHANKGPRGQDIVCAGVSALTQTAVLGLDHHLGTKIHLDIASGNLKMCLLDNPDPLTNAVLETMLIGLTEIAKKNPQSVRIFEHRR